METFLTVFSARYSCSAIWRFIPSALNAIAATTLANVEDVDAGRHCPNEVRA